MIPHWTPGLLPAFRRTALATTLLAASLTAAAPTTLAATVSSGPTVGTSVDLPDLTLKITASDYSIPTGGSVDFTFTMSNVGKKFVNSTTMAGTIDGATTWIILQQPGGGLNPCTPDHEVLRCTEVGLGAGASATVKVRATASSFQTGTISAGGIIDSDRTEVESDESNNSGLANVSVYRQPDLTTTVTSGPNLVSGGARVHFKVLVQNLGGNASHIGFDFRATSGLIYEAVDFVGDLKHGFTCEMHNPSFGDNYVSCSGGSLGDPNVSPTNDESVTLNIEAKVKERGLSSKDKVATATVDPDHTIVESRESNNGDTFAFHYD